MNFSNREILVLADITDRLAEYAGFDDRPDHGFARLKAYRDSEELKETLRGLRWRFGRVQRQRAIKQVKAKEG